MKETTPRRSIADGLARIRQDSRFASLCYGTPPPKCSLGIWIIEIETGAARDVRLLYGWVIRSPSPDAKGWSVSSSNTWETSDGATSRYRFRRLVLNESSAVIFSLIGSLCEGRALEEACRVSGAPAPETRYAALRIGSDADEVDRTFVFGPVRFLEPPMANHPVVETLRPLNSPSSSQPAFSAALVRLNKGAVWTGDGTKPLPGADEMARKSLQYLRDETGIDFVGLDSKRLGDLEWIALPAADAWENEYVEIDCDWGGEVGHLEPPPVGIAIRGDAPLVDPNVLVRCRFYVGDEIASDECRETVVGAAATNFHAPNDASRVLITLWTCAGAGRAWNVWYETTLFVIKEITSQTGIMGLQGKFESDWTRSLRTSREDIRMRTDKVRALNQVFYQASHIGKRPDWEIAERQIKGFARKLFPAESGGKFFPKGWAAGEPGVLGFVEWFLSLTNDASVTTLLLVDPYFDVAGVAEVLARARATQIEYVVVTNCQVPSDDDQLGQEAQTTDTAEAVVPYPGTQGIENPPPRAARIEQACSSLREILSGLKFRIVDLRSKRGGRRRLIHDRYLLTFSGDEVRAGYHLSNSIQNATQNYPMLVTPIPSDVIESLSAYTGSLMEAAKDIVGEAEVIELCSSSKLRSRVVGAGQSPGQWVPYAGEFFSALLGDQTLRALDDTALKAHLRKLALLERDEHFALTDFTAALSGFARTLVQSEFATFARLWSTTGWWLAHLRGDDAALCTLVSGDADALGVNLARYLEEAPRVDPPEGVKGLPLLPALSGRAHLFRRAFGEVLSDAFYVFRDGLHCLGMWGVHYASRLLAEISPDRLVSACDDIGQDYASWGDDSDPSMWAAVNVLGVAAAELLNHLESTEVTSALLRARVPLFRAIAVQSLVAHSANAEAAVDSLQSLERGERLLAMSEWVAHLRVSANRNAFAEDEQTQQARTLVFARIVKEWPNSIDEPTLRDIARRLSGPIEGSWAVSITTDLFAELVRLGQLTWEQVAALWLKILTERIEAMLSAEPRTRHHFYAPTDEPLTRAFAWTLVRCDQTARARFRAAFSDLRKRGARKLATPFARSRDLKWFDRRDALRWIQATIGEICLQGPDMLASPEQRNWSREYYELERFLAGFRVRDASPLDAFLDNVNSRVSVAGNS